MISYSPEIQSKTAQIITVLADWSGQRIDNFLLGRLKKAPRTYVYRILRKGEVRVNKGRVKPTYRIQEGDQIRIPPTAIAVPVPSKIKIQKKGESLLDLIIYQNDGFLIVNKPAGVAVHGGSGISYGVIELLRSSVAVSQAPHLELVHRLDKETSGCLIIAKKRKTLRSLHALFRDGNIRKRYLCLVKGEWNGNEERVVQTRLLKVNTPSGERWMKVSSSPLGQESTTVFRLKKQFKEVALLEAFPLTGRTHQIRVHAAHMGHPILGDEKYGDKSYNAEWKSRGHSRLYLHAEQLEFKCPLTEKDLCLTAPLDQSFKYFLSQLY